MSKLSKAVFVFLMALTVMPLCARAGAIDSLKETGKAFASVAKSVSPSVVFITVNAKEQQPGMVQGQQPYGQQPYGQQQWPFGNDFLRRFFGQQFHQNPHQQMPQNAPQIIEQGSGFIFASDKHKTYIMTNNHVVAHAERIRVRLNDGREFTATVKGKDPSSDVAIIEIKAGNLPVLKLADSSKLEVGQWVIAIGNPFGLSNTLTVGVVSAKGRTSLGINDYEDFIQTDAAINPGNSGGPLVNLDGKVVGMNTAIFTRSGGYMGIGFAIPINLAKVIGNQLIATGKITRGYLGIGIQNLTSDLAESFGIKQVKGILVTQVYGGSPADKAGFKQGDVIVGYNGRSVSDVGELRNRVSLTPPGSRRHITVIRNGERKTLTATIGTLTKDELAQAQGGGSTESAEKLGLTVQTLTPQLAQQFNTEPGKGVVITDVASGSIAEQAGLRPGAVILQVNRKTVTTAAEFRRALRSSSKTKKALMLVRMGDAQQFVVLDWN